MVVHAVAVQPSREQPGTPPPSQNERSDSAPHGRAHAPKSTIPTRKARVLHTYVDAGRRQRHRRLDDKAYSEYQATPPGPRAGFFDASGKKFGSRAEIAEL